MMARRFIFEHKSQPLLSYSQFLKRMMRCALWSMLLGAVTILIGTVGYHAIEHQSYIDAMLNSVLIMTGLGLINNLQSVDGKLFTAFFALLSPVVFYSILAILFTPLLHRFLHGFHLDK